LKQIRKRLTYANVMSSIAVFLVLGGATAFAAGHLGKNTVGTKQLKKNAVTTAKIKKHAVTGAKIKLSSLGAVPSATNASHADQATTADKATTSDKATTADHATNADNSSHATNATNAEHANVADVGGPRAYARVLNNSGGLGVDASASNIPSSSVSYGGGNVYCFELGFTPTNVEASVDWIGGSAGTAQPHLGEYILCPAGTDASVRTTDSSGGGVDTINFFISFFN